MAVKITCIKKANGQHENAYTAIESMKWSEDGSGKTGSSTRLEMYNWIKNDKGEAYVKDAFGNMAVLITAETSGGTKYVKTKSDNVKSDNLLNLPECN